MSDNSDIPESKKLEDKKILDYLNYDIEIEEFLSECQVDQAEICVCIDGNRFNVTEDLNQILSKDYSSKKELIEAFTKYVMEELE